MPQKNKKEINKRYYEKNKDKLNANSRLYAKTPKAKEYAKKYYKKNKDIISKKRSDYDKKNRDKKNSYQREYRKKNKHEVDFKRKQYNNKNKDRISLKSNEYKKNNKEKISIKQKEYDKKNKSKKQEKHKKYYKKNKHKILKYQNIYRKKRSKKDVCFKIKNNLRKRLCMAIKRNEKKGRTIELLGCSIEELKIHLELKFTDDMTWENHGEWHIDHIIPCAAFDFTKEEAQVYCFHYTNLQPLWGVENRKKQAKVDIETLKTLDINLLKQKYIDLIDKHNLKN